MEKTLSQKDEKRAEALILRKLAFKNDQSTFQNGVSKASLGLKENFCKVFSLLGIEVNSIVSSYVPIRSEINTIAIVDWLREIGCTICLPVIEKENHPLKFFVWEAGAKLVTSKFGIPIPASRKLVDPNILLCPLVSFDKRANRLGYGGGYYDRTIQKLREQRKVHAFGVAFSEQQSKNSLPSDDFDQKLDAVITDKNYFIF